MSIVGSRIIAIAALALAGASLLPAPAAAENPFISFLRGDWLRPRAAVPAIPYAPDPGPGGLSITVTPRHGSGNLVYCVRTCDGRYFPLSGVPSGSSSAAVERCNSFCPASPTRVFVSNNREAGIDAAYSKDGDSYKSLPNAYAYRTELNPSCRCNDSSTLGMTPIDIMDDPTLKPGDMIVTETGVMVFRGDRKLPHVERDFSSAREDRKLPASMRRQVEAIEMASGIAPAAALTQQAIQRP